jgi:hypothetical protein
MHRVAGQPASSDNEESKMLKLCTVALLASLCCAGAASAHSGGGGGFEPMPGTNFTDMPRYWPARIAPAWLLKARHVRWQPGFTHRH